MASCSTINEEPEAATDEAARSANTYKLSRLYLACGTFLSRELLLLRVNNTPGYETIDDFLANSDNKTKILGLKNNKKLLSQSQIDIIYPSNDAKTNVNVWDISILTVILTHCFDLQVIETNFIQKVKQFRSYLFGRSSGFSISDAEFETKWTEMSTFFQESAEGLLTSDHTQAIQRLVTDIHSETVSSEHEKEFLRECHKLLQEMSDGERPVKTKNNFKETTKVLRAHSKFLERMHLTSATTEMSVLISKFKSSNILVLKGPKGSGKTYLAQSIMWEMIKEEDTEHVILRTPAEIQKHLGGRKRLVVLVDGALGSFVLDQNELQEWNSSLNLLQSQVEEGKLMLIFTIRANILEACKDEMIFRLFKLGNIVDVTTFLDKRNALVVHAAVNEVRLTEDKIRAICSIEFKGVGFHLMCSKFVKGTFEDIVRSFKNPVHALKDEVHAMQAEHQLYFITLILTLLTGNKLKIGHLRGENSDIFNKMKNFWSSISLDPATIENAANDLVGLYLTTAGDGYSFLNETALETVFLVAIETVQSLLIEKCPLGYIRKFTDHVESHRMSFSYLINRLKREANLSAVARLPIWTNEVFVKEAVEKLGVPFFYKQDSKGQSLVVYFSENGHLLALKQLDSSNNVLKHFTKSEIAEQLKKALMEACANSHPEVVEYLVKSRKVPVTNEMIFKSLYGKDDPKVFSFLINNGADIKATRPGGENVFHVACEKGKLNIVEYIYIVCEELSHATDKRGWTALHFVAKGSSIPCYEFVNNYRKYPADAVTKKGSKVIHIAAEGSSGFLGYLVSQGFDTSARTSSGQTVLHLAALLRNIDIIWFLCEVCRDLIPLKDEKGWNSLHYAAQGGSVDCVRYLIDHGLDPRSPTGDGRTVLHIAAGSGMHEALDYLCKTYRELFSVNDSTGRSPLYVACLEGYSNIIQLLIELEMDPYTNTFRGETIVHACIRNGSLRNLQFICQIFSKLLASVDKDGNNILHFAVMAGSTECLAFLLSLRLNPFETAPNGKSILHSAASKDKIENVVYVCEQFRELVPVADDKHRNALYYAAMYGRVDMMKYLLHVGCDIRIFKKLGISLIYGILKRKKVENAIFICETVDEMMNETDADGNNPLHYSAIANSLPFMTYLLESKNEDPFIRNYLGKTILHIAAYYGHLDIVKHICRTYGSIMKMVDSKDWSALHDAACGGSLDCLIYLIRKGIKPMVRTSDKRTILHIAAHYGRVETTKWICGEYRSMLTEIGDSYWTVLHDAASGSSVTCLRHLIKQGVDAKVRTVDGKTVLHVAACFGKTDTVDYLCAKYKDMVNESDYSGNNALHFAAMGGNLDNFIALVLENVDKHAVNLEGGTSLHTAAKSGSSEIVEYICRNHLELLRIRDRYGWTALHSAAAGGSIKCTEVLIKNGMNPEAVTNDGATIVTISMEHPELHEWIKTRILVRAANCSKCVVM